MPEPSPPPDEDLKLIQEAQQGSSPAFEKLVTKYQNLTAGLLHRFATSHAELEDLVQETFLKVWRHLPDWKPEKPFHHWLKKIAFRTGLEIYRKRKTSALSLAIGTGAEGTPLWEKLPADAGGSAEALREIQHLMAFLPAEDRMVIHLSCIEELSLSEISEILGWSLPKTKIRNFRARQKLQKILKAHGYE